MIGKLLSTNSATTVLLLLLLLFFFPFPPLLDKQLLGGSRQGAIRQLSLNSVSLEEKTG